MAEVHQGDLGAAGDRAGRIATLIKRKVTAARGSIEVGGVPIRLNSVASPELDEPIGQEAKAFMVRLVAGKAVRCELNGDRSHDRMIGVCFLDGQDIGATIIAAGLARDCPRFSGGRYDEFNTAAPAQLSLPGYCLRR